MPRQKITTAAEREIVSLLAQKKTPEATLQHLEWISRHLGYPLWQVKTVATRNEIRYADSKEGK